MNSVLPTGEPSRCLSCCCLSETVHLSWLRRERRSSEESIRGCFLGNLGGISKNLTFRLLRPQNVFSPVFVYRKNKLAHIFRLTGLEASQGKDGLAEIQLRLWLPEANLGGRPSGVRAVEVTILQLRARPAITGRLCPRSVTAGGGNLVEQQVLDGAFLGPWHSQSYRPAAALISRDRPGESMDCTQQHLVAPTLTSKRSRARKPGCRWPTRWAATGFGIHCRNRFCFVFRQKEVSCSCRK